MIRVTPLQPPFTQSVMIFEFERGVAGKDRLAVSLADGARIKEMLDNKPAGRHVVLEEAGGGDIFMHIEH